MTPPSSAPDVPADRLRQRRADAESLDVGAARQERHVDHRRQDHAEDRAGEEHAPLIGADDAPPAAPPAHPFGVAVEHEAGVRERRPCCAADRARDVAGALAHAVAAIARPVRQHDVGDAAGARVRDERAEQEEIRPAGKKSNVPRVRSKPVRPSTPAAHVRRRHEHAAPARESCREWRRRAPSSAARASARCGGRTTGWRRTAGTSPTPMK